MERLVLRVRGSTDRDVLEEMANRARERGFVSDSYPDALLKRERSFPTGIFFPDRDFGLALPHADPGEVNRSALVLGFPETPVTFCRMEDPDATVDVEIVVLLILKDTEGYNRILSCLVKLFQEESFVQTVRGGDPEGLLESMVERCFE